MSTEEESCLTCLVVSLLVSVWRSILVRFSARRGSVSLPAQLGVQAWLQGEGIPRACWVVAKAVRLRSEALQRRRGVSLEAQRERKAAEARRFLEHSYSSRGWAPVPAGGQTAWWGCGFHSGQPGRRRERRPAPPGRAAGLGSHYFLEAEAHCSA